MTIFFRAAGERTRRAACLLVALGSTLLPATAAWAQSSGDSAWSLAIENDWLAGSHRDADYTGGLLVSLAGPAAVRSLVSTDGLLGVVDGWLQPSGRSVGDPKTALQFGLQWYTPKDKKRRDEINDDRPYASLISLTSTRLTPGADDETVWASSLTLGLLGTGVAESVHRGFHRVIGGDKPHGYDHQISDGGEPTLRYTLRRQALLGRQADVLGQRADFKWAVEGSAGFITEAALLASGRIGRYSTPWWSLQSERSDFPLAPGRAGPREGDLYLSYGAAVRLRGYNALLQGQFRHSDVTVSRHDMEPVIGEVWGAVTWGFAANATLSYLVRYQSSELRHGVGSRDTVYGGLYLTCGY